ncbi:MAG: nucleotidyl transferase AbiEii/AbiGii toxin family protein [ANME-2 cluster archaeon]|nr:nucleotidyl transferase AbiEii/AbiGii toxin family protein [ANME-2 cluster archaeon]
MLTRKQIEKLANKNRVSLFTQERDYIQASYLSLLYSKNSGLIFKGGTCLRIVYGSPRYSEDLDFNSALNEDEAYSALEIAAGELEYFGIETEIKNKRMSRSGFGFALSYRGPLYDGRNITKGSVRVDVSLRDEEGAEDRVPVHTEYDDVRTFIVSSAALGDIFAEKVRALLVRGMPRDLYDLWFLLGKGVEPDLELINRKLALYERVYSYEDMIEGIAALERSWGKDMGALLGVDIPFGDVAGYVVERLEGVR